MPGVIAEMRHDRFEELKRFFPDQSALLDEVAELTLTKAVIAVSELSPETLRALGPELTDALHAAYTIIRCKLPSANSFSTCLRGVLFEVKIVRAKLDSAYKFNI